MSSTPPRRGDPGPRERGARGAPGGTASSRDSTAAPSRPLSPPRRSSCVDPCRPRPDRLRSASIMPPPSGPGPGPVDSRAEAVGPAPTRGAGPMGEQAEREQQAKQASGGRRRWWWPVRPTRWIAACARTRAIGGESSAFIRSATLPPTGTGTFLGESSQVLQLLPIGALDQPPRESVGSRTSTSRERSSRAGWSPCT